MRVISTDGQKDYYDSLMQFDEDREIQYIRHSKEYGIQSDSDNRITDGFIKLPCHLSRFRPTGGFLVGFCGQLFHGIQVEIPAPKYSSPWWDCIKSFYDVETMDRHYGDEPIYDPATWNWYSRSPRPKTIWKISEWRSECEKWFAEKPNPKFNELFAQFNCPVFVLSPFPTFYGSKMTSADSYEWRLTLNPSLKLVEFMRIKYANTTYMELSTYVGGVLVNPSGKEPLPVSDELKRDAHGMDNMSFKKDSTKQEKHNKRKKK